jgi:hypothetical protein
MGDELILEWKIYAWYVTNKYPEGSLKFGDVVVRRVTEEDKTVFEKALQPPEELRIEASYPAGYSFIRDKIKKVSSDWILECRIIAEPTDSIHKMAMEQFNTVCAILAFSSGGMNWEYEICCIIKARQSGGQSTPSGMKYFFGAPEKISPEELNTACKCWDNLQHSDLKALKIAIQYYIYGHDIHSQDITNTLRPPAFLAHFQAIEILSNDITQKRQTIEIKQLRPIIDELSTQLAAKKGIITEEISLIRTAYNSIRDVCHEKIKDRLIFAAELFVLNREYIEKLKHLADIRNQIVAHANSDIDVTDGNLVDVMEMASLFLKKTVESYQIMN